ncbi:MAG: L-histidine N(alpha)-methyltransferase [Candidatus Pacebacteria bacterium]|nr:L-histidine N(alpha)-methyltransferase [Candidatus Paceibacterota bacterium]
MDTDLTKTQELELLSSLESRAESPLKFGYIGDGYDNWVRIAEKSRENHDLEYEEDMLKKESLPFIFREINENIKTVNIIDFGCGDGVPMFPIFDYLERKGISGINYIPVDISQAMLDGAINNIKGRFPSVNMMPILFDFEKGEIIEKILQISRNENTHNYFFLLGNTIGNFDNTEKVLSNLKMSMFSDDYLIVGNQISNLINTSKIIKYYQEKEKFDFFVRILKNYGMECYLEEYVVKWNENKKQIEGFLVLDDDKEITIAGRTLRFEKNEEILLFISKKYVEESIVEMLNKAGFRIDLFTTNKKKNNCIISISPSRYKS